MTHPGSQLFNQAEIGTGVLGRHRPTQDRRVPITVTWGAAPKKAAPVRTASRGFRPRLPSGIHVPGKGFVVGPVAPTRTFPIAARASAARVKEK